MPTYIGPPNLRNSYRRADAPRIVPVTAADRLRNMLASLKAGEFGDAFDYAGELINTPDDVELPQFPEPPVEDPVALSGSIRPEDVEVEDFLRRENAKKYKTDTERVQRQRSEIARRDSRVDPTADRATRFGQKALGVIEDVGAFPGELLDKLGREVSGDEDFDRTEAFLRTQDPALREALKGTEEEQTLRKVGAIVTDPMNATMPSALSTVKGATLTAGAIALPEVMPESARGLAPILAPLASAVAHEATPSFTRAEKPKPVATSRYKLPADLEGMDTPPASTGAAGHNINPDFGGATPRNKNFQFNPQKHTDLPNWILRREAAPMKAAVVAHRDFADLAELRAKPSKEALTGAKRSLQFKDKNFDPSTMEGQRQLVDAAEQFQVILDFENNNKATPEFVKLSNFFERSFKVAKAAGIDLNRKQNYITHVFAEDPKVVYAAFKKVGLTPSFSKQRAVQDYITGVKIGLTPKFTSINDVLESHIRSNEVALADRKIWNAGRKAGLIGTKAKNPDFLDLDTNITPFYGYTDKKGDNIVRPWAADPIFKEKLENYLRPQHEGILGKAADISSDIKEMRLSAGLLGHNTQTRRAAVAHVLASGSPFSKDFKDATGISTRAILSPRWAQEQVAQRPKDIAMAARAGVRFSDDPDFLETLRGRPKPVHSMLSLESWGKALKRVRDANEEHGKIAAIKEFSQAVFEDPTHQAVVPLLKVDAWKKWTEEMVSQGMHPLEAQKTAAKQVNEFMSGLNYKAMMRDKHTQQFFQALVLAPDHYESQGRLAIGMGKALLDPSDPAGRAYLTTMKNIGGTLATMQALNYMINGHSTWENGPGKELSVQLGEDERGKGRYWRPFGNFTDFARIPLALVHAAGQGRLSRVASDVRSRESGLAGVFTSLATNSDWRGRDILADRETLGEAALETAPRLLELGEDYLAPQWLSAPVDYMLGTQTGEEALSQLAEESIQFGVPPQTMKPKRPKRPAREKRPRR